MFPLPADPSLCLLPEGAVFHTTSATLVLADVHLGKSATFRARGLPVPEGDTARDFRRILELVHRCDARNLVIAGDLFHSPAGITPELNEAVVDFIAALRIPIVLVEGNHDRKIKRLPFELEHVPHLDLGDDIRIFHDPNEVTGDQLHLSGHWHPVVKIPDGKRTSLRLPCFLHRKNTLVLPAFGSFTGGAVMTPEKADRIFVALRDQVVELPATLLA